jgi:GAF domain-containing protein
MADRPLASDAFAALTQFFVHDGTIGETLRRVSELACEAGPADMVGITMLVEGKPSTGVFTDEEAPEIDKSQYGSGEGPCLDAFRTQETYRIDSTATETRWPDFVSIAASHGIKSTLSLPITARGEGIGALNLYARAASAFSDEDVDRLRAFASQAAFVLANAQLYWDSRQLSQNLTQAMESRATIEHAVGIVMAGGGKSPEEAFEVLARASQRENRKLRDIAQDIVERAMNRPPRSPEPEVSGGGRTS